jgi:hypothetical protein
VVKSLSLGVEPSSLFPGGGFDSHSHPYSFQAYKKINNPTQISGATS